jgi:hypothetical protein
VTQSVEKVSIGKKKKKEKEKTGDWLRHLPRKDLVGKRLFCWLVVNFEDINFS